ncbi:hypothetical protein GJAV_G00263940 [Gymnothorax javanicus]|nr:hypothetical protein GJAV_G00263940 [Gymnothorax javanicus]
MGRAKRDSWQTPKVSGRLKVQLKTAREGYIRNRKQDTSQPLRMGDPGSDANSSAVLSAFKTFQLELDGRHDKYERLVKLSRDITIESKRTIFLLHRVTSVPNVDEVLAEAEVKLDGVRLKICQIAEELRGEDLYQFHRAFTPGIQEYVEAVSFQYFIRNRSLITLEEVNSKLVFHREDSADAKGAPAVLSFQVTPTDYLLGVADLTGELMRMCIASVGNGDIDTPFQVGQFLREIYDGFSYIGNTGPYEVSKKLYTLKQSLAKVEDACYTLKVRGSEIPTHMLADVFTSRAALITDADDDGSFYTTASRHRTGTLKFLIRESTATYWPPTPRGKVIPPLGSKMGEAERSGRTTNFPTQGRGAAVLLLLQNKVAGQGGGKVIPPLGSKMGEAERSGRTTNFPTQGRGRQILLLLQNKVAGQSCGNAHIIQVLHGSTVRFPLAACEKTPKNKLRRKSSRDGAVCREVGRSFHHWGARWEKLRDLVERPTFRPRAGAAVLLLQNKVAGQSCGNAHIIQVLHGSTAPLPLAAWQGGEAVLLLQNKVAGQVCMG